MRPVIKSTKHYVQFPIDQVASGVRQSINLVNGVNNTAANLPNEVIEGAIVKAIFIELWLENQGNLGESIVCVTKDNNDFAGPSFVEMAALFTYTNKKNVLFTHQGLTSNDGVSQPTNILRGWIKIPRSKQRFGLGDTLTLSISNVSTSDLNRCGFATYKEYS